MRTPVRVMAVVAVAALGLAACGGGSGDDASSSGGGKKLVIATDLPLQGVAGDAQKDTNDIIEIYLESVGYRAGDFSIELKKYDNSTATAGSWDAATCSANAQKHVADKSEVAVLGEFNSGCTKLETPVLNQAPDGHAARLPRRHQPGLTKAWDPGEPELYAPSGKKNFARVITTDDFQGTAAADFAKETLKVTRCYILNDNQTYGQGVSKAFQTQASKIGIEVLGNEAYDPLATNYTALFEKIKQMGPDCVYVGGIYDANGGQLLKDKISVLGDNDETTFLTPDGWSGYPALDAQPESEGLYATFAGLATEQLMDQQGVAGDLLTKYRAKYGRAPRTSYALYGVAAVQVIMAAIEQSDGTRKGVRDAVFEGAGITIPAEKSATGKEIVIDPATGDTNAKDISVMRNHDGVQKFLQAQPVK